MPASTMTYVMSYIKQNIPSELLELAFKARKNSTTIEQRIMTEVIDGPILLDTNLVGGKRREIYLNPNWKMDFRPSDQANILGSGMESSFYLIPPEAREFHNIASVIGVSSTMNGSLPGLGIGYNGAGSFGNTATGMISEMLNTRTFAQTAFMPMATLEGTNIIKFYPEQLLESIGVAVMLEYDSEFINMKPSAIYAMRDLCLCAVQRYIVTQLRVSVDETEIVAGMEVGIIKTIIDEYVDRAKDYPQLLIKLKGAMHFDPTSMSRLVRFAL